MYDEAILRFASQYHKLQYRGMITSQNRNITLSHCLIVVVSRNCNIAISQIAGTLYMIKFVNLFSAKCDLRSASSHIGKLKCFNVNCAVCDAIFYYHISQSRNV